MFKKKFLLMIIINILSFICYKLAYNFSNIKTNYEKWHKFYEKYKFSPFNYIDNYLPFSKDYLFLKISNFCDKLSFFIYNSALSIEDYEENENENEIQLFFSNNVNKTNLLISETDLKYDDFFIYAIDEMNILDNAVEGRNKIKIKSILEGGMNRNKIIILFIFFVQQLNIFQHLKQKIDLNKIYLLGRNRTNIEKLENDYEMLFNYEDIQEILSLSQQFIDYHKDYGFFFIDQLKKEKIQISQNEIKMINIVINLKNKNFEEYKNLNDYELSSFLDIFEKTARSIKYLAIAESSYKKGYSFYTRDANILKLGFIALAFFINVFIMVNYEDKDTYIRKRKKYKFN